MEWLKNAAAKAQASLQEAGVVEKLAPVASVANETKTLFSQFGSSLEESFNKKTAEAKSGSEGDVSFDKIGAPWVTSHLGLKPFEADMKASMLKITEGSDEEVKARLKERVPDDDFTFDFLEPSCTKRAMAALEADANLKKARHKLVPSKIKEEDFWRSYFYKCEMIVQSYLKMCVESKRTRENTSSTTRYPDPTDNLDFEGAEFVSDEPVNKPATSAGTSATKTDSGLSWEEEMAKELEGIDVGPSDKSKASDAKPIDDLDDEDFEKELGI
ncbi:hypothetical protein GUITHDRAFT_166723 [Guillardia theta CCMP2712]|uniref:BSD domain-containing protein n=1 Tax=Guillardia theta (strain CCMP2712) TaxID=905079 RepID=L1I7Z4_GUITC|nr:hypothetical protein GUITHDRAFT_166723 [Guillardia theta CCMP2712]EKX32333.1 hypothetical protein GUITHDRAFT_166723 [Guillardia theta CCMP2712]|eukprot:XP_005819313.1 hypothetical protein GUITHDRAFT_166723 [Guillardia theta CCMP2712]